MESSPSDEISIVAKDAVSVIESQERANIDMLISTAKRYPRDLGAVKRNMEAMATLDEETAESCNYHLERNGKAIDGPSVRMAEIAVAAYQNIRAGSRVIANDGKTITGQAFCHDLENNTFIAWETQRRITDKSGRTYGEDMQVVTGNAASAIAFRNAVFKVIPAALIKPIAEKARAVAAGDVKTLVQRRTRALKKFAALGVTETQILATLGRTSVEKIDLEDITRLFGIYTAIREGSTSVEEQFGPAASAKVTPPSFGQTVSEQLPRRGRPPKKDAPAPEQSESGAVPDLIETGNQPEQKLSLNEQIKARLAQAGIDESAFLDLSGESSIELLSPGYAEMILSQWDEILKQLRRSHEQ